MAKHVRLTTDAGEQADDDNSEPELDELVGSDTCSHPEYLLEYLLRCFCYMYASV